MIVIVPPGWYGEHGQLLREMHRMRYRVFKERLSWKVEVKDGEERDRFDDLNPVYVIALDEAEKVVGSWRLVPTTGPYMLRDVFSDLLLRFTPPDIRMSDPTDEPASDNGVGAREVVVVTTDGELTRIDPETLRAIERVDLTRN